MGDYQDVVFINEGKTSEELCQEIVVKMMKEVTVYQSYKYPFEDLGVIQQTVTALWTLDQEARYQHSLLILARKKEDRFIVCCCCLFL